MHDLCPWGVTSPLCYCNTTWIDGEWQYHCVDIVRMGISHVAIVLKYDLCPQRVVLTGQDESKSPLSQVTIVWKYDFPRFGNRCHLAQPVRACALLKCARSWVRAPRWQYFLFFCFFVFLFFVFCFLFFVHAKLGYNFHLQLCLDKVSSYRGLESLCYEHLSCWYCL